MNNRNSRNFTAVVPTGLRRGEGDRLRRLARLGNLSDAEETPKVKFPLELKIRLWTAHGVCLLPCIASTFFSYKIVISCQKASGFGDPSYKGLWMSVVFG